MAWIAVQFGDQLKAAWDNLNLTDEQKAVMLPLAGVVAGAALAFLWNFGLRRRDEKRELRAVARLVDVELAQAAARLDPDGRVGKRVWDPPELRDGPLPRQDEWIQVEEAGGLAAWQVWRRRELLNTDAWGDHKLLLARYLKYADWDALRRAYAAIERAKENATEPTAPDTALDMIAQARTVSLLRIDRARAIFRHHIGDAPMDPFYWEEAALDEEAANGSGGDPPRPLPSRELARRLRSAVQVGTLSAREAEALGGYLVMRAAGGVPGLPESTRERREERVREFGFVLDSSATPGGKETAEQEEKAASGGTTPPDEQPTPTS